MADRPLFTNEAARKGADVIAKSIADPDADPDPIVGHVRLFDDSIVPDVGTTLAELISAAPALIGYPALGYPITGFDTPKYAPGGGAVVTSNLIDVAYASGAAVAVGGYVVTSGASPNEVVREIVIYDPPRALGAVGDGWPIIVQLGYGGNAS